MARERKPKERSRLPTTDAVSLFQFPCDGSVTRLPGNGRGAYVEQNSDRKRSRLVDMGNATDETYCGGTESPLMFFRGDGSRKECVPCFYILYNIYVYKHLYINYDF